MSALKFFTITARINPEGKVLKPDANGYYTVNFGAFNFSNTSGEYYKMTPRVMSCFTDPKSFMVKRIIDKALYGEFDHPAMPEEINRIIHTPKGKMKWMERQMVFDPKLTSHHIKSVMVKETNIKDPVTGDNKFLVTGLIKPFGPMAKYVKEMFENPDMSSAFSIRSAVLETMEHGRVTKEVVAIFTYDSVYAPGIKGSTDQHSVGLEIDSSDIDFMEDLLVNVEGFSQEDANGMLCDLKKTFLEVNSKRASMMKKW